MILGMRHIGIIVEDIDRAIKTFKNYGLDFNEPIEIEEFGMNMAVCHVGNTEIEFLSFSPDKGWDPIHTMLRSQKGALNHICLEVDDLETTIQDFENNGAKLVSGTIMTGAHGRVAFLSPETTEGVVIELCEL